ncbi:MAG: hypothetical protein ABI634_15290 [Acidobacteriota bacterium]
MKAVRPEVRRRELGGPDPLDRRLGVPKTPSALGWLVALLRRRSALGLAPALTPAVIFLPLGALLGPHGLAWFSPRLLGRLDLAVTIALAVLGVLVGIALGREIRTAFGLFLAASLESVVTTAAVAAASAFYIQRTGMPLSVPLLAFSLALGLCASASSATSADPDSEPAASVATRVADLDDVVPIVLAVGAFALLSQGQVSPMVLWLAPPVVGLSVGAIGWLVFDRAESGPERVVFVLGALALAGGAAAYLRVSPLAVGLVAGLTWTVAPGRADRVVEADLRKVQHPLVVLLLVTAGAHATLTAAAWWLLPPYLLFRLAGKVTGAWLLGPRLDVRPSDLASYLMPPGVLAVAFALNFRQVLPQAVGDVLLSTVALGTAAFELFALAVVPHWRRRAVR